jgi:hypothetical protein
MVLLCMSMASYQVQFLARDEKRVGACVNSTLEDIDGNRFYFHCD